MKTTPLISVVIPVFGTEKVLRRCLESVAGQSFRDFEIILVNDGSEETDEKGRGCKKILKEFLKEQKKLKRKLAVEYIEHSGNKGLLEARRTGIYAAHGKYIFNLDSDDWLPAEGLEKLVLAAADSGAQIVHGGGTVFGAENDPELHESVSKKINLVISGLVKGHEIFERYHIKKDLMGFLWGKLIDRELYLKALDCIPYTFCIMAEDLLQFLFISYFAESYFGITDSVYNYSVSGGISSVVKITSLERWEKVCSTASVFTVIFDAIDSGIISLSELELEYLKKVCCDLLKNNLYQWDRAVDSSIKDEALEMLCDYWGKDFVLQEKEKIKL